MKSPLRYPLRQASPLTSSFAPLPSDTSSYADSSSHEYATPAATFESQSEPFSLPHLLSSTSEHELPAFGQTIDVPPSTPTDLSTMNASDLREAARTAYDLQSRAPLLSTSPLLVSPFSDGDVAPPPPPPPPSSDDGDDKTILMVAAGLAALGAAWYLLQR